MTEPIENLLLGLGALGWSELEIREVREYLAEDRGWQGTMSADLSRETAALSVNVFLDASLDTETIARGVEYVLDYLERPGSWLPRDRYELLLALVGETRRDPLTLLRLILKARRLMRALSHRFPAYSPAEEALGR